MEILIQSHVITVYRSVGYIILVHSDLDMEIRFIRFYGRGEALTEYAKRVSSNKSAFPSPKTEGKYHLLVINTEKQ